MNPHTRGGKTQLINGQALCPDCNLKKGAHVDDEPLDTIKLRPFQEDLAQVIGDRIAAGHPVTVGWVNAGSGKTLGWIHAANELYRAGQIDGVVCLVPRLTLRKQAELDWTRPPGSLGVNDPGGFTHFYGDPKIGPIVARDNSHGRTGVNGIRSITESRHFGYVTTYSSLTTDRGIHLDWARNRSRRFLLVCDEAQFLGCDEEEGGGTEAGRCVTAMAEYALHTVLLTGTPYRSDRKPIVMADYTEPNERRERHLEWHVRATYRQGVAGGYLRDFQSDLDHGTGRFSDGEDFDIASLEKHLGVVLSDQRVWQGLVDSTVERLRDVRRLSQDYKALICTSNQDQAEAVLRYIGLRHRDMQPVLAISRQNGGEAQAALDGFRAGHGDVLVTVSKAYIGYDCKQITVVGLLTSRRWDGYLQQIVARGLRVWSERPVSEQTCFVVGPADPRLVKFCRDMRADAEQGLRDRPDGPPPPPPPPGDEVLVDDFLRGGTEAIGLEPEADLSVAERMQLAALRKEGGLHDGEARLGWLLRKLGHRFQSPTAPTESARPPETEEEQRVRLSADCTRLAAKFVHTRWPDLDKASFSIKMSLITGDLNAAQDLPRRGGAKRASLDQMVARRRILLDWINSAESVSS